MECGVYSHIPGNQDAGITCLPFDRLVRELRKTDLIIPFGISGNSADIAGTADRPPVPEGVSLQASISTGMGKQILHIDKSQPDNLQDALISALGSRMDSQSVSLFDETVDYDGLIDLIFEYGDVVTWW